MGEVVDRVIDAMFDSIGENSMDCVELALQDGRIFFSGDFDAKAVARAVVEAMPLRALLDALEPFADIVGEGSEDHPDDTRVEIKFGRTTFYGLKLGELRRAQEVHFEVDAALSEEEK